MGDDGEMTEREHLIVSLNDSDKIDGMMVKEFKMTRDGPVIKLYDSQKAMQELQKRLGDGNGGKQIIINNPWGVPYGPKPD